MSLSADKPCKSAKKEVRFKNSFDQEGEEEKKILCHFESYSV